MNVWKLGAYFYRQRGIFHMVETDLDRQIRGWFRGQ